MADCNWQISDDTMVSWQDDILICICDRELKQFIENILNPENVTYSVKHRSKYNSYVEYDYEPVYTDGFLLKYEIKGERNLLKFIEFLLNKLIDTFECLENMYKGENNVDKE